MSKIDRYFEEYALDHQSLGNQRTHLFGIPMIIVAILSWASSWVWLHSPFIEPPASLFQLDLGVAIIAVATAWYCTLDWRLGLAFAPTLYGFYWVGRACTNEIAWGLFVFGWILQGIGHGVFEKKSPAFLKSAKHLLIGPLWIFVKTLHLRSGSTIPYRS